MHQKIKTAGPFRLRIGESASFGVIPEAYHQLSPYQRVIAMSGFTRVRTCSCATQS